MIAMIGLVVFILSFILLTTIKTFFEVEGDSHYGHLGFGSMTQSAANAFSSAMLDAIVEPDIIIKPNVGRRRLEIDIEQILVWDIRKWFLRSDQRADEAGAENSASELLAFITADNSLKGNDSPKADSVAEGTRPGGDGAAVTGDADGTPPRMVGDESPRFEAQFQFIGIVDEEQTAVGQILLPYSMIEEWDYSPYQVDGLWAHHLLTSAHYALSADSNDLAAAATLSLGGSVRRMGVDFTELLFDRDILLSILDALSVQTN